MALRDDPLDADVGRFTRVSISSSGRAAGRSAKMLFIEQPRTGLSVSLSHSLSDLYNRRTRRRVVGRFSADVFGFE